MCQKIREVHGLKIPRDVIYDVMKEVNPEGLEARSGVGQSKRKKRNKRFTSPVSLKRYLIIGRGQTPIFGKNLRFRFITTPNQGIFLKRSINRPRTKPILFFCNEFLN